MREVHDFLIELREYCIRCPETILPIEKVDELSLRLLNCFDMSPKQLISTLITKVINCNEEDFDKSVRKITSKISDHYKFLSISSLWKRELRKLTEARARYILYYMWQNMHLRLLNNLFDSVLKLNNIVIMDRSFTSDYLRFSEYTP